MTEVKPFRVAIIGAGNIAGAHYRGYTAAGAQLVAIAEPFEVTRQRRETEWGVPGYATVEELLEKADFEAVSICTPNAYHHGLTLAAAKAGKHILCEKPLSMSIEQCDEMIQVCREAGVVLQTGHHLRSNLYVEQAKQIIDAGGIGDITFIRLRQAHDWSGSETVSPAFGSIAQAGGGTMLDNGCHMYDLARHFAGDVKSIFARTATLKYDIEVEDVSVASLEFASGALGSVENSWTATGWEEGFWVYGTQGVLECQIRNGIPRYLKHITRIGGNRDWSRPDEVLYSFTSEGGHPRQVVNFMRSIREGQKVICTGEDGRESVRLVLQGYESARNGQVVTLL
ncbi:Gfo/Idh/MocA family protein [Deinococcus misasensis]|uniref:Gfo/Idh/MocA family protein n=1 Tax=Deinococcus misasensis TaxID=392413 RepID=UPI00054D7D5E|nr:Gfo/Idh/MocA family oxidoreductase [Deinococcus misasensis]